MDQDTLYWIWLAQKCGAGSKHFRHIIEKYDNPFEVYRLEDEEIGQFEGISPREKERLCEKNLDEAYAILKYCKQNHIEVISYGDRRYPQRLKQMEDPPALLYCKGFFPNLEGMLCIGVVGTRRMSEYGKQSTVRLVYELASAGVCTVSGMALGIDGAAACGALAAGGTTLAVLGCGLATVYPKNHTRLMEEIVKHGAVISEYAPNTPPYPGNFPLRNRIISGLSQGLFVAEAARNSGALITAKYAHEQGKEIFALPGKISDEGAQGPNELISGGAYPVLEAADILEHYDFIYGEQIDKVAFSRARSRMPAVDDIVRRYGLDYAISPEDIRKEPLYSVRSGRRAKGENAEQTAQPHKEKKSAVGTSEAQSAQKTEPQNEYIPDGSEKIVAGLDPKTKAVYDAIERERAVGIEHIKACTEGVEIGEIMTAVTMLEIQGLISSLPGGLYIKK